MLSILSIKDDKLHLKLNPIWCIGGKYGVSYQAVRIDIVEEAPPKKEFFPMCESFSNNTQTIAPGSMDIDNNDHTTSPRSNNIDKKVDLNNTVEAKTM